MRPIDSAGFEAKFSADIDPWDYRCSHFELIKRRVLLRACGVRRRARVLELACANGETTIALVHKAMRLLALDGSPTAVEAARCRTNGFPRATVCLAELPRDMPRGRFDLIVVSELLYYLPRNSLRLLLLKLQRAVACQGRIVLLHHRCKFADASVPPIFAHTQARGQFQALFGAPQCYNHGRYEVLIFDRTI